MLPDKSKDIEVHLTSNKNINMYVDLSSLSIPLCRTRKFDKTDLNKLNNNVEYSQKHSLNIFNNQPTSVNNLKVPINVMPPPPHKMGNYSNKFEHKDLIHITSSKYDIEEDLTLDNDGEKGNKTRNGFNQLTDSSKNFGKYSQNTPDIYQANLHYHQNNYGSNKHRHQLNNTHRQKPSKISAPDIMLRRAHGLVERFKSRSGIMKVNPSPPDLLTGTAWDLLNQAIWDVFSTKAQKEKTYEMKVNLWKHIFLFIRKCLSSYGLFMVGSTMSGFGLDSSDIDMCLLTKPCTMDPRLDSLHHLNSVRQLLLKYGVAIDSELIMAKVPILKFRERETGFEIDLNCNNAVGIRNTHLLYNYSKLDWRVRPLVVIVKLWAQSNNINDAKNMTVSSYSFALMVIHYLQCGVTPPVLPCLHGLVPGKFNSDCELHTMDVQEEISAIKDFKSDNTNCLGELLLGFLQYYSYFNYNQYAISVRAGCRLPIDECRFMKAPKNDPNQWKYICIEEPFDFTNTARSVLDLVKFKHIKDVIFYSYKELNRTNTLSSILPVNLHIQR